MRHVRTAGLAVLALLSGACAGPTKPATAPTISATPTSASSTPTATPPQPMGPKIVYAPYRVDVAKTPADLFLWDTPSDTLRRLTNDASKTLENFPRFHGTDRITYAVRGTLMEVPTTGGMPVKLVHIGGEISGLDWNKDETVAAVLVNDVNNGWHSAWLYTANSGTLEKIWQYKDRCGREPLFSDESSITWSPDSRMILVVETCTDPATHVLRPDGTNVLLPLGATHARWSHDSTQIYAQRHGGSAQGNDWFVYVLNTKQELDMPLRKADGAAISPTGRRIAFFEFSEEPSLYIYDFQSGRTDGVSKIAEGYANPVWLSDDELVATDVGSCGDVETCGEIAWEVQGSAVRIKLDGSEPVNIKLRGTDWFEGYRRQSDVLRP